VRTALRGLESRNAEVVGQHLVAAGGLLDDDPDLALEHARAARDRASRLAVVREAVGVAAYHAGDYAEAAKELRAYRRMSGDEGYRAVLADCERALGRPDNALRLVSEALAANPEPDEAVELRLVEAGARHDLGELPAALLVLATALGGRPSPSELGSADLGRLRLAIAYADLLEESGEDDHAAQWYGAIAAADPDDLTGVSARFGADEAEDQEGDEAGDDAAVAARSVDDPAATATQPGDTTVPDVAGDLDEAPFPVGDDVHPDDIEAEVAELLGETPSPRAPLEFDHSRLFQEPPGPSGVESADEPPEEQHPPTN
jgi:tetratricopeptide (TPR) repeat protein